MLEFPHQPPVVLSFQEHLPVADLVFIEYALNDPAFPHPYMKNPDRAAFERLVRKVGRSEVG